LSYSKIRLDGRGQLSTDDVDAQGSLRGRAGEYILAPSSPDWMVFLRSPAMGGHVPPPRVVLAGDAAAFPISDLIAFLSQSRWSGLVRVHSAGGARSIELKDGEVRSAMSEDPADRLGEVMLRLGYIDRKTLEAAVQSHPPSKLGRALVEKGVLQAHDLWKCITHQITDVFHAIVMAREGSFVLVDQPFDEKAVQNVQLSTQSLLMDAIRMIDEMAHFRKRIGSARMFVIKKRPSDGKLEPEEDTVLAQVNGNRTVLELGQLTKLSEFDVTKVIFRLLEGGYVSVSERAGDEASPAGTAALSQPVSSDTAPAKPADAMRVIQTFNSIFREIRNEVAQQKRDKELLSAANAALTGKGLSASPALMGMAFDGQGSLPEDKLHAQFQRVKGQLGSEPVASLREALSDLMFFLLFQAGELLESRADEDLARRVKELLATLES
jgi:hypothetical protein